MTRGASHQRGSVVLECRHVITILLPLPVRGETQYCRLCNDYRIVQDSHDAYVVKCNTGKCKLNRNMKADKAGALALARKHVAQYSRHRVTVFDGMLTCAEVSNTDESLFATAESRSAIAADTQKLLKDFAARGTAEPDGMG